MHLNDIGAKSLSTQCIGRKTQIYCENCKQFNKLYRN